MFVQGQYGILSVNWLRRQLTGSDGETDRQQGRRGKGMGEVGRRRGANGRILQRQMYTGAVRSVMECRSTAWATAAKTPAGSP